MKKKKPHSQDTENKILTAAEKVFAEKGLKGARINDIAEEARVTPSLVNYHFRSKENLYKNVIENFYLRMERRFYPIMEEDIDPQEKLKKLIASGIEIFAEKDHLAKIILIEAIDEGKYTKEVLSKPYLREIFDRSDQFVYSKMTAKSDHGSETMHLISSIIGCVIFSFANASLIKSIWKRDVFSKKMVEERKEEVVDLIFNGIGHRFK